MKRKIAIVSMAYRLPGSGATSLWNDLLEGRDLVTTVDASRWSLDAYLHPDKSHPGTSYTFAAGSIGDIAGFDAGFFGISPREAALLDPQQRLLLELSWEAFENAGVAPASMKGSDCGVFVGIASTDYAYRFAEDLGVIDAAVATGNSNSIAANRISYVFDLHGPSMSIDTACSSSLVAFHQACQAIESGTCRQALVAGVNLHLHPYGFIAFSKAAMLSRKGYCSPFDAAADGYTRSEGAGVFVLRDYELALAEGNPILAVVGASMVNTDGRKAGLAVPSCDAQAALLESAYAKAGIDPAEVDYIETHGTGTAVGDPVEARALGRALGRHRSRDTPLLIGSVKSNLGHLETAAGVAGLVKALHCIEHRQLPPTIHFNTPNPAIAFDEFNLRVVDTNLPLAADKRIVIGINSFGFGGANAHVVLESAGASAASGDAGLAADEPRHAYPVVVSGKTREAARAAARGLACHLRQAGQEDYYAIARAAACGRDLHEYRAVVFATGSAQAVEALESFDRGDQGGTAVESGSTLAGAKTVSFVYTGNGSQWQGMGRRLLADDRVFREGVEEVDRLFGRHADFSLVAELAGENGTGRYALTEVAQPALFAFQVGLTRMLAARGVVPQAVCGHSVGEVAAGWACGALTLPQAVAVVYHRSRLQGTTRGKGGMTAVAMGQREAEALLLDAQFAEAPAIAGINSPRGVTLSGSVAGLEAVEALLARNAVPFKRLDLDYAFHAPAMDPIEGELLSVLGGLSPVDGALPFVSTVSGERVAGSTLDARYWWLNIRRPTLFCAALTHLLEASDGGALVEIGPHPVLRGYMNDVLKQSGLPGRVVVTGMREDESPARIDAAAAQVLIATGGMDFARVFPARGRFVRLPNYPWQRAHHWHAVTPESLHLLQRPALHPLLGHRVNPQELQWSKIVDTRCVPFLADHVVGEAPVFPGSAFAEVALAAAGQWQAGEMVEIEDLELRAPLLLAADHSRILQTEIDPIDGSLSVRARDQRRSDAWQVHAVARIVREPQGRAAASMMAADFDRLPDFDARRHQDLTLAANLRYGSAFRAVERGWVEGNTVWARLAVPDSVAPGITTWMLHPALLDCTFQLIIHLMGDAASQRSGTTYVPARIGRMIYHHGVGVPRKVCATLKRRLPHALTADFSLFDAAGRLIAVFEDCRFDALRLSRDPFDALRFLAYQAVPRPLPGASEFAVEGLHEAACADLTRMARSCASRSRQRAYFEVQEPLLEALCGGFAAQAVRAVTGNAAAIPSAAVQAGPGGAQTARLARLLAMLEDDGMLVRGAAGWTWAQAPEFSAPQDIWNSLIAEYPGYLPVVQAVGEVGAGLADMLLRSADSVEQPAVAVPDADLLARLALGPDGQSDIAGALRGIIAAGVGKLSEGQRFRILEVGAGTATFAADLCAGLNFDCCDYVIAADGAEPPVDWHRLKERFPALSYMPAAAFDGVQAAGARCGAFQLIIAGCGLAAQQHAPAAVARASRVLAVGGTMVLLVLPTPRWADFVFGAPSGWAGAAECRGWRGELARHWQQSLRALGHGPAHYVELQAGAGWSPGLLVSRKERRAEAAAVPLAPVPGPARTWILLADRTEYSTQLSLRLARRLESEGHRVVHAAQGRWDASLSQAARYTLNLGDAGLVAELIGEVKAAHGAIDGVIHLSGLGVAGAEPKREVDLQVDRCMVAAAVAKALEQTGTDATLWVVTAGAATALLPRRKSNLADAMDAPLAGFTRSLMNEVTGFAVRLVDLERARTPEAAANALAQELLDSDGETEVILTAAWNRFVPRLRLQKRGTVPPAAVPGMPGPPLRLGFRSAGQLRNLAWEQCPERVPQAGEIEIDVRATGVNFRDVMYTLGMLSDEALANGFAGPTLGLECAGLVRAIGPGVAGFAVGDAVLAFAPSSFGDRVITPAHAAAVLPAGISFEEAATIPSAFFTAYYALFHLARLEEDEKILIHGAAGGVGIAAIQLAKLRGAEIFATAGTPAKRAFLRTLGVDHVFDSRSLAFADQILVATQGEGVDLVLNSLAGEAISRNLRILKPFGRFVELGKRDFYENTKIGLRPLRNNISYFGVDADQLMAARPDLTARLFAELLELFRQGELHPLPYRAFEADDVVDAFRYMQQSRQIGKIVVTYRNGINDVRPAEATGAGVRLSSAATYLVTGGLGGFGLATARWLVARGARHLVLVGRRGAALPEAQDALAAFRRDGIDVLAVACDISDESAASALFARMAAEMPPLRGLVHAAAVIEDGLVRNLTRERMARVFAPKITGARNLHQLTRGMRLDFFILYSSATTLFGNPGQGSYVAANAYLEALAEARRADGLPALCVRWGAIDDVGFLARDSELKQALQGRMGGAATDSGVALRVLDELLVADRSGLGVLDFDWTALRRFLPSSGTPKFAELGLHSSASDTDQPAAGDLRRLVGTVSEEELGAACAGMLKDELGQILRLPPESIEVERPMVDMGLDSLMAVELVVAIEARLGIKLPVLALSESPTIASLSAKVVSLLSGADAPTAGSEQVAAQVRQLVGQHSPELDADTVNKMIQDAQAEGPGRATRMIH